MSTVSRKPPVSSVKPSTGVQKPTGGVTVQGNKASKTYTGNNATNQVKVNGNLAANNKFDLKGNPTGKQDGVVLPNTTKVTGATQDKKGNLNLGLKDGGSAKKASFTPGTNNVQAGGNLYKYQAGSQGKPGGWQSQPFKPSGANADKQTTNAFNQPKLNNGKPVRTF